MTQIHSSVHRIHGNQCTYVNPQKSRRGIYNEHEKAVLKRMAKAKATPPEELRAKIYSPQPEEVESVVALLKGERYGLSTASIAHLIGRRGDVRIRKICQWMESEGVLISRLSNHGAVEIWELRTPEAIVRSKGVSG